MEVVVEENDGEDLKAWKYVSLTTTSDFDTQPNHNLPLASRVLWMDIRYWHIN